MMSVGALSIILLGVLLTEILIFIILNNKK